MVGSVVVSSGTGVPDLLGFTVDHAIIVRGARVHNLRNVDVAIPRDKLVVITDVSGSGKSSLAFDTLFAEGQRQYIESLSAAARQYVDQLERPDVDLIEGLQPTIAIDQRVGGFGPRSTVGTATEVYDYLRVLYARVGQVECYRRGTPIRQQSPEQIGIADDSSLDRADRFRRKIATIEPGGQLFSRCAILPDIREATLALHGQIPQAHCARFANSAPRADNMVRPRRTQRLLANMGHNQRQAIAKGR